MTPGDAAAGRVRVRPTGELWQHLGFPALFATLALELRQDLVFLLGALVVGCALCAAPLCRRNLQGLLLTRRAPRRARAGVASAVVYELTNTRRRPAIGVEIQEARPRGVLPALARLEAECVGAGRQVNARCAVTFARRGMQVLAPAQLSSRFPLGAFRAQVSSGEPEQVLVWPHEGRATPRLVRRLIGPGDPSQTRNLALRGSDELYGLSELREGDEGRRLHARGSARRGRPIVADWRALQGTEVLIVLAGGVSHSDLPTFERAVSAAATLWSVLHRHARPGQLLIHGRLVNASASGRQMGLDRLALARWGAAGRNAATLRRLARGGQSRHVVVVAGPEAADLLALARRAAGPSGAAWRLPLESPQRERWITGLA